MKHAMNIALKRAYEVAAANDGFRVLVDRLWPRGVTKRSLHLDLWDKDLAPSPALRTWFGHETARWTEFQKRYRRELSAAAQMDRMRHLVACAGSRPMTLVYGAKDTRHTHALVLREMLRKVAASAQSKSRVRLPTSEHADAR